MAVSLAGRDGHRQRPGPRTLMSSRCPHRGPRPWEIPAHEWTAAVAGRGLVPVQPPDARRRAEPRRLAELRRVPVVGCRHPPRPAGRLRDDHPARTRPGHRSPGVRRLRRPRRTARRIRVLPGRIADAGERGGLRGLRHGGGHVRGRSGRAYERLAAVPGGADLQLPGRADGRARAALPGGRPAVGHSADHRQRHPAAAAGSRDPRPARAGRRAVAGRPRRGLLGVHARQPGTVLARRRVPGAGPVRLAGLPPAGVVRCEPPAARSLQLGRG